MRLPDISIHALREEGDLGFGTERLLRLKISIHALREEGDYSCDGDGPQERISIHALREEGDFWWADVPRICIEFLSTPSARRATSGSIRSSIWQPNFYPRPPRGGRHNCCSAAAVPAGFLSTPSARRATCFSGGGRLGEKFLSTPSARRATRAAQVRAKLHRFLSTPSARRATYHFIIDIQSFLFLSTPSARRAT